MTPEAQNNSFTWTPNPKVPKTLKPQNPKTPKPHNSQPQTVPCSAAYCTRPCRPFIWFTTLIPSLPLRHITMSYPILASCWSTWHGSQKFHAAINLQFKQKLIVVLHRHPDIWLLYAMIKKAAPRGHSLRHAPCPASSRIRLLSTLSPRQLASRAMLSFEDKRCFVNHKHLKLLYSVFTTYTYLR